MALASAIQEAKLLGELIGKNIAKATDNQSAIFLSKNPVQHQRSKNIDIRYHFIRSEILSKTVNVKYVRSEENLSDLLTKPITRFKIGKFIIIW